MEVVVGTSVVASWVVGIVVAPLERLEEQQQQQLELRDQSHEP